MFTKYANVRVPENYSGNRFKSPTIETEMKTHRSDGVHSTASPVKTSLSPYFKSKLSSENDERSTEELHEVTNGINEIYVNENQSTSTEINATPPEGNAQNSESSSVLPITAKDLSRFLGNFKSDDILLLALILLVAKEGSEESTDALILLALLLLFR